MKREEQISIVEFTTEFIKRIRKFTLIPKRFRPSVRQSIAISRLLTTRYMRKHRLTRADFIEAAVVTSHPEIKNHVEKIAWESLSHLGGPRIDRELALKLVKPFGFKTSDEETLKFWFKHRGELTEKQKNIMREQARQALAAVGLKYARFITHDFYVKGPGPVKGYITRQYRPGVDDPSLIDFESTIENAMIKGKKINSLSYEDFETRQVRRKRRSVLYLQDISASFRYGVLLNCAVCGSMLIYGLPKDDQVTISLFSDDIHVVKKFFDKEDKMSLMDKLLSIEPMKGTNVSRALTWARKQFEGVGKNYVKFCLIFSDMGFERKDVEKALDEVAKLQDMEVKIFFLKFDPFIYHFQEAIRMLDESGCEMIDIERLWDFPELIGSILSSY